MNDQRGIVARVVEVVAQNDIKIESLEQEPHLPRERLSCVITVQPVSEPTVHRAMETISAFDFMFEPVLLLRMK